MSEYGEIKAFKNMIYQDKVYSGVSDLRRRMLEPQLTEVDLRFSELRIFSQNGEDGILIEILRHIEIENPFFVEFGVGDGWSCNTRILSELLDWKGVYFEMDASSFSALETRYRNCEKITTLCKAVSPENVNQVFEAAGVPANFGVLSIDIDGQDYWVWEALDPKFKPDVVVAEVNLNFGLKKFVAEELGSFQTPLTETWGTSIRAMEKLGNKKGYDLVHIDMAGINAFFVRRDQLDPLSFVGCIDRSPNYGLRGTFNDLETLFQGHEMKNRPTSAV